MLKNFRRPYWLLSSFLKKHALRIFGVAILTVIVLIALPQAIDLFPTGKPHYKIGRVGQFTVNELPLDIQRQISSGLTSITPEGTATPSMALSWRVSDEGKTYSFKLRDDVTWHDDQPFQAADLDLSFEDIDINVLSSHEVEFKLKEAFSPFPTALTTPIFRRAKTFSKILKRPKSELVGTGEYQVKSVKRRGQQIDTINLESIDDKRTYKFYTTEAAAILGFKLGEVNTLEHLTDPGDLATWRNLAIEEAIHSDRYVAVFFNNQDPFLADKNFRQSLTYAIPDKPEGALRALGPVHPDSWAVNPQVKEYASSLARAKELFEEVKDEDEDFAPTVKLDTPLAYLDLAEKIKRSWEELGITVEVHVINFPSPDYQALLAVHQIPPDPDQYTLWHSTQGGNITHLQSPKIDKLLEDGRKTQDISERKEIYQDFQRFLLEESPAAFLFYQTTYTISRK